MSRIGRTAVVVPLPELDPLLDAVAVHRPGTVRAGVPAHLTVLYPFVPADRLDAATVDRCRALCAAARLPRLTFDGVTVRPGIAWTAPGPSGPVAALARSFAAAWPDHPPYGGRFGPDPDPHVTLALAPDDADGSDLDGLDGIAAGFLPVSARPRAAELVRVTDDGWRRIAVLPLGNASFSR